MRHYGYAKLDEKEQDGRAGKSRWEIKIIALEDFAYVMMGTITIPSSLLPSKTFAKVGIRRSEQARRKARWRRNNICERKTCPLLL